MKKIYIPLIAILLIVGLIGGIIIGNILFHPQNTNNNIDRTDYKIQNTNNIST